MPRVGWIRIDSGRSSPLAGRTSCVQNASAFCRTHEGLQTLAGFHNLRIQPLCQLSVFDFRSGCGSAHCAVARACFQPSGPLHCRIAAQYPRLNNRVWRTRPPVDGPKWHIGGGKY